MGRRASTLVFAAVLLLAGAIGHSHAGELHDAAAAGDLETIERLLAEGVDVDQEGIASPLFFAARAGQVDAVVLLADGGADLDRTSKWGTSLHIAVSRGHIEVVRVLLEKGADPNIPGGDDRTTPLHDAARKGEMESVELLLASGADPNARNRLLEPPLHLARGRGHEEVAAVLVEAGAAPKAVEPVSDKIAQADPEAGRLSAIECGACHSLEAGKTKAGPTLWDVVGRDRGSLPNFPYSDQMKAVGGAWDYEALNQFLADPTGTVPGTSMELTDELDLQKRADLIAYLRTLSDSPVPLP